MNEKNDYDAESIKVLEGLEGVRKNFDILELSDKIKKKGDVLILSRKLRIKPRVLNAAVNEARILRIIPDIQKSKADILAGLKTDREVRIISEKFNFKSISPKRLLQLVRGWKEDIQKNPFFLVTQEEHDLVIGSLMGDASVRQRDKNCCFRVSHSKKQEKYIRHKMDILKNFEISEFSNRKKLINNHESNMFNFSTKTHPVFNYYRKLFYGEEDVKKITYEILKQLTPRALAYWICDDGSYSNSQGYIILCTNSFSLDEHKIIKSFFNEKFGLDPTIGFRDKKYYYLRFKQEDSKKLIKIIKPHIHESMLYKIGEIK